jgi:hypothetical protein
MKKVLFVLTLIGMVVMVRPHRWQYEYRKLKQKYLNK